MLALASGSEKPRPSHCAFHPTNPFPSISASLSMVRFAANTDPLSIVERQWTSRSDARCSIHQVCCVVPESSLTRTKMKRPRKRGPNADRNTSGLRDLPMTVVSRFGLCVVLQ